MAVTQFIAAASERYDFADWSSTGGTVTIDNSVVHGTNPRSFKLDSGAGPTAAFLRKNGVMADAGRRVTFWVRFPALPASGADEFATVRTSGNVRVMQAILTSAGKFRITPTGATPGTGTITLETNRWYCIGISYTITSSTSFEIRGYIDGVLDVSISSSGTLTNTGSDVFRIEGAAAAANWIVYADEVVIDDGTDLAVIGGGSATGPRVAAKLPDETNTGNFDTTGGTGAVNERALSETNYKQHANTTDVQQNYTLQTATEGDNNLTNGTLLSRKAWVWAKRGDPGIAFLEATAEASAASGNITLTAPASPQTNDVWIAVVHSSDQVAHTLTDWTQIVQGNGGGTTSRLSVWYFRYAGSTPNLIVGHTAGQSPIGGIVAFRGCKTSGSPVNVAGSITGGTDASIEHAAITPTVANCCLLVLDGAADDNARTALGGDYVVDFEDSAGGTQNCYQTTAGNPDGSVSCFHDIAVPASDTGIISVTQAAADAWASVLIALEPDGNGDPKVMDNGSETSLTLTTTAALYTKYTDSASYPSNAAGIGMRSSGTSADTFFYEGGTAIVWIPPNTATAAVMVGAATASGSGTFTKPTYTASAAVMVGASTASGAATFTKPTYTATAAVSVGAATASGAATFTKPTYTGSAAVTVGASTASGAAMFTKPTYTGTAGVTIGPVTCSAAGTFTAPVYTGTAALMVGAAIASGAAVFTPPIGVGGGGGRIRYVEKKFDRVREAQILAELAAAWGG